MAGGRFREASLRPHRRGDVIVEIVVERGKGTDYFGKTVKSGSHLRSLEMVMEGKSLSLRRYKCATCGSMMFEQHDMEQGTVYHVSWSDFIEMTHCHLCRPDLPDPMTQFKITLLHITKDGVPA